MPMGKLVQLRSAESFLAILTRAILRARLSAFHTEEEWNKLQAFICPTSWWSIKFPTDLILSSTGMSVRVMHMAGPVSVRPYPI